jgi:hypothetical protein
LIKRVEECYRAVTKENDEKEKKKNRVGRSRVAFGSSTVGCSLLILMGAPTGSESQSPVNLHAAGTRE